jgi:hypothetical protein
MTDATAAVEVSAARPPGAASRMLLALGCGALVSVALGVYSRVHDPTHHALFTLVFTATINLKVWFATIAATLALVQVLSAARLYGKIKVPRAMPAWFGDLHRLTGTLAFLFSLPVAFHCLWGLGFAPEPTTARVLAHSLLGCVFYGAFATKMVIVRSSNLPDFALPLAGGVVFATLVGIWLTSALWFFGNQGFPRF